MLRYTSLLILLSISLIVVAQPLYKWVEQDGTITFSPVKPPKGIKFETINPATGDQSSSPALRRKPQEPPMPQPSQALPVQSITPAADGQAESAKLFGKQQRPVSSLEPSLKREGNGKTGERLSSESGSAPAVADLPDRSAITQAAPASQNDNVQPNRKQRQCQDLQKRVISLERRLRSRLTPEDMDNTVVHMARYQRSYDQHCVQ